MIKNSIRSEVTADIKEEFLVRIKMSLLLLLNVIVSVSEMNIKASTTTQRNGTITARIEILTWYNYKAHSKCIEHNHFERFVWNKKLEVRKKNKEFAGLLTRSL